MSVKIVYNPDKVIRDDRLEYYAKKILKKYVKFHYTNYMIGLNLGEYKQHKIIKYISEYIYNTKKVCIIDYIYICISEILKKSLNDLLYKSKHSAYELKYDSYYMHDYENTRNLVYDNTFDSILNHNVYLPDCIWYGERLYEYHKIMLKYTKKLFLEEDDTFDTKPAKLIPYTI